MTNAKCVNNHKASVRYMSLLCSNMVIGSQVRHRVMVTSRVNRNTSGVRVTDREMEGIEVEE